MVSFTVPLTGRVLWRSALGGVKALICANAGTVHVNAVAIERAKSRTNTIIIGFPSFEL